MASDEAIRLLRSIDASLKALLARRPASGATAASSRSVASDRDLDSKYGDPELKFMPRDWIGPSFKGRRFSECPPDLLDMVAETFEYFASEAEKKDERTTRGKPTAEYKRADAARARGWAKRMREGKCATPTTGAGPSDEWTNSEEGWSTTEDGF